MVVQEASKEVVILEVALLLQVLQEQKGNLTIWLCTNEVGEVSQIQIQVKVVWWQYPMEKMHFPGGWLGQIRARMQEKKEWKCEIKAEKQGYMKAMAKNEITFI